MRKDIAIKVYRPSGEFLKDWSNLATFETFSKEINGGLGECILTLGVPFDYNGSELNIGNTVEILISDKQTTIDGFMLIYSGYISLIEPIIDERKDTVIVHLLGHYTKLSLDYLKNSNQVILYSDSTAGLTTTSPGSVADIGLILRGIIDRYRSETVNPILSYTSTSIPLITQTALYSISLKTYREAFDSVCSMLPSGYFWYVDENGIITIKSKSLSRNHIFEFKKHFKSLHISKSLEKVRNFLLVWNGEPAGTPCVFNHYSDQASISQYGRRSDIITDYAISDNTSADKIGAKFIAENKDPVIKITCEILDDNYDTINGYDIDSVNPGDTCTFVGFDESSDILQEAMLITKIDYYLDRIILEIELQKTGLIDWQEKTSLKVEDISSQNVPPTYT